MNGTLSIIWSNICLVLGLIVDYTILPFLLILILICGVCLDIQYKEVGNVKTLWNIGMTRFMNMQKIRFEDLGKKESTRPYDYMMDCLKEDRIL